jgi:Flp pilus assembly protein protease CpaA
MIILESLLLAVLAGTLFEVTYTDVKSGIIGNRILLFSLALLVILNSLYYLIFEYKILSAFLLNLVAMSVVSVLLYWFGIWGAGDSKLMMLVTFAIPARFYYEGDLNSFFPGFILLIVLFTMAFAYVLIETLFLGLKQKNLMIARTSRIQWKQFFISFFSMTATLNIVDSIFCKLFSGNIANDPILLLAINFVLILLLMYLNQRIDWHYAAVAIAIWVIFLLSGFWQINLKSVNIRSYTIVLLLLLFRGIANKFNYKSIATNEVKAGMILSWGTIVQFSKSKVHGLPQSTTEDLRSRLTPSEVESILRWQSSKYGAAEITVVRKIPFAIFISISTVVFVLLEVLVI